MNERQVLREGCGNCIRLIQKWVWVSHWWLLRESSCIAASKRNNAHTEDHHPQCCKTANSVRNVQSVRWQLPRFLALSQKVSLDKLLLGNYKAMSTINKAIQKLVDLLGDDVDHEWVNVLRNAPKNNDALIVTGHLLN